MAIPVRKRFWIRALFACVLAVAVLIPTVDICICADDLALSSQGLLRAVAADDSAQHDSGKGVPCQSCHCLHMAGVVRLEQIALGASASPTRPGWAIREAPPAATTFTLLRPPRA